MVHIGLVDLMTSLGSARTTLAVFGKWRAETLFGVMVPVVGGLTVLTTVYCPVPPHALVDCVL